MNNYILKQDEKTSHFLHIPNQGLAVRTKHLNLWQNHKIILPDSSGVFAVFKDDNDSGINIVSINKKNEIIYMLLKDSSQKAITLTTLKEGMTVEDIALFKTQIGLNIIYTARYQGRLLLIHCVLGNNAMPDPIDELSSGAFSVHNSSVYYTNSGGVLGYKNLSDGKADIFNSITPDATAPYLYNYGGKDFLTYLKDGKIYLQNRPVASDPAAKNPLITEEGGVIFVMWQSGDFLRYVSSQNRGETFSSTMQYVSPGKIPSLICAINGRFINRYFATISPRDIHIYQKADVFSNPVNTPPQSGDRLLSRFRVLLDMEKKEVIKLKKEVAQLSDEIARFQKNNMQKPDNF